MPKPKQQLADGGSFARSYKPEPVIKCKLCRNLEAAKFVAEVAAAMEADPTLHVPLRVLGDELATRFDYRCVTTAIGRHVNECLHSKAWRSKHGGTR